MTISDLSLLSFLSLERYRPTVNDIYNITPVLFERVGEFRDVHVPEGANNCAWAATFMQLMEIETTHYKNVTPARFGDLKNAFVKYIKSMQVHGFNINGHLDGKKGTALHVAAREGNTLIASALKELGADINAFSVEEVTPLQEAIQNDHFNTASQLVYLGADVNNLSKKGNTSALVSSINPLMIRLLIGNGAKTTIRGNKEAYTPLHFAVNRRAPEALKELLLGGCLDTQDKHGETALDVARRIKSVATEAFSNAPSIQSNVEEIDRCIQLLEAHHRAV